MSSSVNKVILVGNLGSDPETKHVHDKTVCEFRLATNEVWNDKSGQRQERVEWHRIVVWGKKAEACGKYLTKGRQAYVEGKLRTRNYDDKDGIKRYITEVEAFDVQFLGGEGKKSEGGSSGRTDDDVPPPSAPGDDIPF